jgi:hypothetical protein
MSSQVISLSTNGGRWPFTESIAAITVGENKRIDLGCIESGSFSIRRTSIGNAICKIVYADGAEEEIHFDGWLHVNVTQTIAEGRTESNSGVVRHRS